MTDNPTSSLIAAIEKLKPHTHGRLLREDELGYICAINDVLKIMEEANSDTLNKGGKIVSVDDSGRTGNTYYLDHKVINNLGNNPLKREQGNISVIDKALEEAAKIVLNLKPEMNRNKADEWEACYATLFRQLNEVSGEFSKQKRESGCVKVNDMSVEEIARMQLMFRCMAGEPFTAWWDRAFQAGVNSVFQTIVERHKTEIEDGK